MRRLSSVAVTLLWMGSCIGGLAPSSWAANLDHMKPYEVEEGRIDYTMSGMSSGTSTLEFTKWGLKSATRTKSIVNIMGVKQETDQLTILDGKWAYNVDMVTRAATKMENPMWKGLAEHKDQTLIKTGEDMMKAMGGRMVGKETIVGKTCEWWEIPKLMSKTCVWKGLALKTMAGMPGMEITQTAVRIDLGSVPDSHVSLPPNVKVRLIEGIDPMKQLREMGGMSRSQGRKSKKGLPGGLGLGEGAPQGQDMQKMLEHFKKMQEEMRKRQAGTP